MNKVIIKERIIELIIKYTPRLGGAILVIIIGPWVVKLLIHMLNNLVKKSKIDISLHNFIESIAEVVLKIVVFITAASMLGVETTTFIAILSAAGLAVGLAIKDSLSNFAGGILILTFKPFGIGDYIRAQDELGTVNEIGLLYTHLNTNNNKRVIIPNSDMVNSKIINYNTEPLRRLDLVFGVAYSEDVKRVEEILLKIARESKVALKDPKATVGILDFGDNSVNFAMKIWYGEGDYWNLYYEINQRVKIVFDREGIEIPFPQRDIHLYKQDDEI